MFLLFLWLCQETAFYRQCNISSIWVSSLSRRYSVLLRWANVCGHLTIDLHPSITHFITPLLSSPPHPSKPPQFLLSQPLPFSLHLEEWLGGVVISADRRAVLLSIIRARKSPQTLPGILSDPWVGDFSHWFVGTRSHRLHYPSSGSQTDP